MHSSVKKVIHAFANVNVPFKGFYYQPITNKFYKGDCGFVEKGGITMNDFDRIAAIVESSLPEFNYLRLLKQRDEHRPAREGPHQPRSRHYLQKVPQETNRDYVSEV